MRGDSPRICHSPSLFQLDSPQKPEDSTSQLAGCMVACRQEYLRYWSMYAPSHSQLGESDYMQTLSKYEAGACAASHKVSWPGPIASCINTVPCSTVKQQSVYN